MEIVIAVAIIAILAAASGPVIMKHLHDAKVQRIHDLVSELTLACFDYHNDVGTYAYEYSGDNYSANTHHRLSMDSGISNWDGPYYDYLSTTHNPFGNLYMYSSLNNAVGGGFDLTNSGANTHTGGGNFLRLDGVPEKVAKALDSRIDKDLPGAWEDIGMVKYSGTVCYIYLYQ